MRELQVHRSKTFIGCAIKFYVYVVDPTQNDRTLQGMPCRLLGKVKRKETLTAEIPEEGCVVMITTYIGEDCKSVSFPAGTETVHLYVKPAMGALAAVPVVSRNEDMSNSF